MGVTNLALTPMDPNGCDQSSADPNGCIVRVVDENEEEEEDEIPLIRKNSRRYIASGESSGVPSPALSALIGLQELSLANFDQTLEDMVPEDLLSEPADGGATDVCVDVLSGESSGVPSPALSALIGLQELSLANFDQTLEDMVPEDLLSEPADGGATDVCVDVLPRLMLG